METEKVKCLIIGSGPVSYTHLMSNSSISIDELAVAMTMSKYAITRLAEGKSYPTDVCYAEFCKMCIRDSVRTEPLY